VDEATRTPAGEGEPEAEQAEVDEPQRSETTTPPIDADVAGSVNAALPDTDE